MLLSPSDLCRIANELIVEHGDGVRLYARLAVTTFEEEGAFDRVQVWKSLSAILDDIVDRRVDPERPITIH